MKIRIFIFAIVVLTAWVIGAFAQAPDTLWTRIYGYAPSWDYGQSVQQTADGGYIVCGYIDSVGITADDAYLIKTDSNGDTLWTRRYGGEGVQMCYCVQQTTDGGYILGGQTSPTASGNKDFYLVKTNSIGDTLWTRTYGTINYDYGMYVQQTADGGYIMAGYTDSTVTLADDIYLVKTDSNGDTLWTRRYYGSGDQEWCYNVQQTTDGGYILGGQTWAYGSGNNDFYLVKTNSIGDTLWTKTYGGTDIDDGKFVQQTSDGGYIFGGLNINFSGTTGRDYLLVKTDSNGDSLWSRIYGGDLDDEFKMVKQTSDGGYILAGETQSYGAGGWDFYIVRTDSIGDTLWTNTYGGSNWENCWSIAQTADDGYIMTGTTYSYGPGMWDVWLIRLSSEGEPIEITITPQNPPIQIPSGGGSFNFDLEIDNGTATNYTIDVATNVTLPGGTIYPIFLRCGINMPAGAVINRDNLIQFVPAGAPSGNYSYNGYVYNHTTWEILAEDSFPFEKLAGDGLPTHNLGWALYGWDDESSTIASVPADHFVISAYPNPFNPETTLSFNLPDAGKVSLVIFDIRGREVATLLDGYQSAGFHQVDFNAAGLSTGIYYAKLTTNGQCQTQKLLLMK